MKWNWVRKNQVVIDKISLKQFRVDEVCEEQAVLSEVTETETDNNLVITMTPANAICFRLLNDPNPLELPAGEFTADCGKLLVEGEKATDDQGDIAVLQVIGKIPGAVVLLARKPDDEGLSMATYEPFHDRFNWLVFGLPETGRYRLISWPDRMTDFINDVALVSCVDIRQQEIKDENDHPVMVEVLHGCNLVTLDRRRLYSHIDDLDFEPSETDVTAIDRQVFIGGNIIQTDNQRTEKEVTGEKRHCYVQVIGRYIQEDLKFADLSVITKSLKYGFVFKSPTTVIYDVDKELKTPRLSETVDYPYLVDITAKGDETVFTFADVNRNVIRLIRKHTKDRGYCYSVEK